ncbi:hypothetical protein B0T26DRAFT_752013 [Lasiosphaeria miniovina]|uniref:Uncharacterized protein n=1 Tax=Lasiosphaeria miniovina TaxID=1954250 RepID=A0AA40ALI7_9PEZI|nr:uncharacterized protein B0T26DRAFT_752013 [Lasiosphaeria miniovina]KAK0718034.1 hypothetical protein B0T26DRAFT_752013 [Lasiosphaeria miniovina]
MVAAARRPYSTTYVTASTTVTTPVTSWAYSTLFPTVVVDKTTTTIFIRDTNTTIATVTSPTVVCTNGGTPGPTVTAYKGSYMPVPGQNTTLPASHPTLVSCTAYNTALIHVWPTVQGGPESTVTLTITSTVASSETTRTTVTSPIFGCGSLPRCKGLGVA